MSINQNIRKEILVKRKSLNYNTKISYDHKIYQKLILETKKFNHEKFIGLYYPINNETDTLAFIDYLLENKYLVCLPSIIKNKIVFKQIKTLNFDKNYWQNIPQPKTKNTVNPSKIDFLIVPIVAYNDKNYRIGYGGHYYNKFLEKNQHIKTIGIAYHFQKNNDINTKNCFKKLDKIIID